MAARLQLDRWEPHVADFARAQLLNGKPLRDQANWQASIEQHFALNAARELFRALDLPGAPAVTVVEVVRSELIESRNLHEHWDHNMHVFNAPAPGLEPLHKSDKRFAERNPGVSPYWWLDWTNTEGPKLTPNASARDLHQIIDAVESAVLQDDPELGRFVPPRPPSNGPSSRTDGFRSL